MNPVTSKIQISVRLHFGTMPFGQSYHNDSKFAPGGGGGEGTWVSPHIIWVCTPLENVMVSYIMARLPAITNHFKKCEINLKVG